MKRWIVPFVVFFAGASAGSYWLGMYTQAQTPAPLTIPKELTSYRDVVKRILPAVVSVESKSTPKAAKKNTPPPKLDGVPIPDEFRKFFEEFRMNPDTFDAPRHGFGSGFFIDPNGAILTNYHVVEGADVVTIQLQDGRKFTSHDIHGDRRTDLAVVRLDAKGPFPYLDMGDSDQMEIGDRVLAVGAPFGLAGSVTHGIVSAKGRNLNLNMYEDFLQTDAPINPGNSGGPLVNLEGKVVGINSAIKTRSGGFQGVGLAVASNLAKNVTKALLTNGVVRRGYLGIQIRDLAPDVAQRLGLASNTGVVVGEVFDNTPASKAGLKAGDIITSINGHAVKDGRSLQFVVAGLPVNKAVPVEIFRDNQKRTVNVTIEEQPAEFGTANVPLPRVPQNQVDSISVDKIGIDVADLTDNLADELGYRKGTQGVVITRVQPGSLADSAGLRKGMLLLKLDNHKVENAAAARTLFDKATLASGVLLQIQSPQGGVNFVLLKTS